MDKFANKYRIQSARLQNWDYGQNAAYFVTICTQGRECYFGDILNGQMILSEIGKIAKKYWLEIPEHFPFVKSDIYVIMPNHVHGIISINKPDDDRDGVETPKLGVSTPSPPPQSQTTNASKKWKPASLGVIINQYKRICTINAKKIHSDFAWQSRFYDHIISNKKSYQKIQDYIIDNPINWNNDKFYN